MGSSVARMSGASSAQAAATASWQQRQQSFKDLFTALQSDNLAGARSALQGLTGGTTVNSHSPLAGIASALQSGDLAAAQKAAVQFQTQRASHHHPTQSATQGPGSSAGTAGATSGGSFSFLA